MKSRAAKYGLYGTVLTTIVGATIAWTHADKSVLLQVDGVSHHVHTTAGTVRSALADAGYPLGAHDLVAPAANTAVRNGSTIVLRRGRLIHLAVDGTRRDVWTTAQTVGDALGALGYSTRNYSSVSRADRLPLGATNILLRAPKQVWVTADGTTRTVTSTDATIGALLHDLRLGLDGDDLSTPAASTLLSTGQHIVVSRVHKVYVTKNATVPYATTQHTDDTLLRGLTRVVRTGKDGTDAVRYLYVYVNGTLDRTTIVSRTTTVPKVDKVLAVGTWVPPNNPAGNQAVARQLLPDFGFGQNQMGCLISMWDRESGWNTQAANSGSGAFGIPQALPGSKMAQFGADWQTNPATQIKWGLSYIKARYGTPCGAWGFWQNHNYY